MTIFCGPKCFLLLVFLLYTYNIVECHVSPVKPDSLYVYMRINILSKMYITFFTV